MVLSVVLGLAFFSSLFFAKNAFLRVFSFFCFFLYQFCAWLYGGKYAKRDC